MTPEDISELRRLARVYGNAAGMWPLRVIQCLAEIVRLRALIPPAVLANGPEGAEGLVVMMKEGTERREE